MVSAQCGFVGVLSVRQTVRNAFHSYPLDKHEVSRSWVLVPWAFWEWWSWARVWGAASLSWSAKKFDRADRPRDYRSTDSGVGPVGSWREAVGSAAEVAYRSSLGQ